MKIFLDGPDLKQIKSIKNVDGYTFNPSLFKKLGAKKFLNFTKLILKKTSNKDLSIEVIGDNYSSCYSKH